MRIHPTGPVAEMQTNRTGCKDDDDDDEEEDDEDDDDDCRGPAASSVAGTPIKRLARTCPMRAALVEYVSLSRVSMATNQVGPVIGRC